MFIFFSLPRLFIFTQLEFPENWQHPQFCFLKIAWFCILARYFLIKQFFFVLSSFIQNFWTFHPIFPILCYCVLFVLWSHFLNSPPISSCSFPSIKILSLSSLCLSHLYFLSSLIIFHKVYPQMLGKKWNFSNFLSIYPNLH